MTKLVWKYLHRAIVFGVLAFSLSISFAQRDSIPKNIQEEWEDNLSHVLFTPAPAFKAVDMDGKSHTIDYIDNRAHLFCFWHPYINPANSQNILIHFDSLSQVYHSSQVEFMLFGCGDEIDINGYLKRTGMSISIPIIANSHSFAQKFLNARIIPYPIIIYVDQTGIIQIILASFIVNERHLNRQSLNELVSKVVLE